MFGHQPRNVTDSVTVVVDPEISKAYFATLKGMSHTYTIDSSDDFNLYVGITVPLLERAETDFEVVIQGVKNDGEYQETIHKLSAPTSEWEEFYESFGGDTYLSGPEYEEIQQAGKYEIVVSSPDNEGQYVLAIGKIESFSFAEILNTYRTLPSIKEKYFDKPWYSTFLNIFTVGLLIVFYLFL